MRVLVTSHSTFNGTWVNSILVSLCESFWKITFVYLLSGMCLRCIEIMIFRTGFAMMSVLKESPSKCNKNAISNDSLTCLNYFLLPLKLVSMLVNLFPPFRNFHTWFYFTWSFSPSLENSQCAADGFATLFSLLFYNEIILF